MRVTFFPCNIYVNSERTSQLKPWTTRELQDIEGFSAQNVSCLWYDFIPRDGDLQIWRFFFRPAPPPRKCLFWFRPPNPPPPGDFAGRMWIYLSVTSMVESDSPLYRSNKQETFFFLFGMNNMHHTRKWSQKRNTSIRSWMILKFWNIWSLVFCGQLIQTSFYPGILVICTGGPEIGSVSRRLWNNPRELAYMIPYFP